MPQDTTVKQLIVNQLSKEQYKQAKLDNMLSDTEIYIITDDYHYTESEIQTLLATKQDKLTTSGKINIDENNVISVDLSDYDSTLGSSLEYENSVLTLVSKDGKVLSNVTIKSTPDVDDTTIHLNNSEQLEVIGNITKDGTTKYDWIGTKEEYEQGLTSGLITSTTACYITNDEINLISGTDISLPTKLSELSNDTNFVNNETLNNSIATKVDKVEGKSLISDTEIVRLSGVNNYDDTEIKQILNNKVDKIDGKSLIDDTEIVRLSGINNYDDTSIVNNITSLQLNKSNTSLDNLTPEGEKHFLNYSQVTNCVTEISQRIKLELNNGTLTLKAGSEVIIPNGFEEDGTTPKFDYVTIENDVTSTGFTGYTFTSNCFYVPSLNMIIFDSKYTGAGTNGYQYDTTTNKLTYKGTTSQAGLENATLSYPIGLINMDATIGIKSIAQVFNGIGYIDSTVWINKGVKVLIPNGRNEDGTLKNIEFATTRVLVDKDPDMTSRPIKIFLHLDKIESWGSDTQNVMYYKTRPAVAPVKYCTAYIEDENKWIRSTATTEWAYEIICADVGDYQLNNGNIVAFYPKLPFRAVDYNDKSTVLSWSMPSDRYIDLTLGASGSSYTMPANGWLQCACTGTAGSTYFELATDHISSTASFTGGWGRTSIPVKKGDVVIVYYGGNNFTKRVFRFTYAEGEV